MAVKGGRGEPFVIERVFDAPVEKVWKAISDKDRMKNWYFNIKEFKPEVGFEFDFRAGNERTEFHHLCRIVEVIPEKKLSYTWRYEGYGGNSIVTFELFAEGYMTRLRLTHGGLETFPDLRDFDKKNFEMGWTMIIGKNLKDYTESKEQEL